MPAHLHNERPHNERPHSQSPESVGTWTTLLGVARRFLGRRREPRHGGSGPALTRLLYYLYEHRLLRQVRNQPIPRHVGIILDGNRRYGKQRQLAEPREIYRLGAGKLDDVLDWCETLGIGAVTLWVCSTDNLKRAPDEVSGILLAVEHKLKALANDPLTHRRGVRVRAVGKLDLLPESTVAAIRAAEEATAGYGTMALTIAVAYGGRQEIADAVRSLLRDRAKEGGDLSSVVDQITPETIGRYLYTPDLPDPDLIIRTSGEVRLSGFLLWQSAYSEF